MPSPFRHAALVGKYQAQGIRGVLEEIAHFLVRQGLEVSLERQTALNTGIDGFDALTVRSESTRLNSSHDVISRMPSSA